MDPLLKKLRYRAGMRVYLRDAPAGYEAAVRELEVTQLARLRGTIDLGHAFFTRAGQVDRVVPALALHLAPTGILWLSYPKAGQLATDLDRDILARRVERMGLSTVAIVAIDAVWSALRCKLVATGRGGISPRPGADRATGARSRATGRRRSRA